jgi:hypothetical protein
MSCAQSVGAYHLFLSNIFHDRVPSVLLTNVHVKILETQVVFNQENLHTSTLKVHYYAN